VAVAFSVTAGPNVGKSATVTTGADGKAAWTYHDDGGAGTDTINAQFTNGTDAVEKATATKTWAVVPPADVPEARWAALLPASTLGLLLVVAALGFRRRGRA
jgi:hypothetical protein